MQAVEVAVTVRSAHCPRPSPLEAHPPTCARAFPARWSLGKEKIQK